MLTRIWPEVLSSASRIASTMMSWCICFENSFGCISYQLPPAPPPPKPPPLENQPPDELPPDQPPPQYWIPPYRLNRTKRDAITIPARIRKMTGNIPSDPFRK